MSYRPSPALLARLARLAGNSLAPRGAGRGRLCIVNYHRILESADPLLDTEPDVATFRRQMAVLADCFHVMPLPAALEALARGRVPPRAVCITFDDGYRSTHELALPILREFGLRATVFVSTAYVGDGNNMWNDRILEAVRAMEGGRLELQERGYGSYAVQNAADRSRAVRALTATAKYLPPAQREELIRLLEERAGVYTRGLMLTPDMIADLVRQGMEIGAHTVSHPILTSLDDAEAMREMVDSKTYLEGITGAPVRYFAYPNGKAGMDFDHRHVAMARAAGFDAAFTTALGAATGAHDRYALPRSRPWDSTPFFYALRLLSWLAR